MKRGYISVLLVLFLISPLLLTLQPEYVGVAQAQEEVVWFSSLQKQIDYGDGTYKLVTYKSPQVFREDGEWQSLVFMDHYGEDGYRLIRNGHIATEIYDYYAKHYNPGYDRVAVYDERFTVEQLSKNGKWEDLGVQSGDPSWSWANSKDSISVSRRWDSWAGTFELSYVLEPGAPLKHDITFTPSNVEGTFRVVMKQSGITSDKLVTNKHDKTVTETESLGVVPYFKVMDGNGLVLTENLMKLGHREGREWVNDYLSDVVVDTHARGMKADVYMGNYTLNSGESLHIDPDTSTWEVDQSSDDCYRETKGGDYLNLTDDTFSAGESADNLTRAGVRFRNVTVPENMTVLSAVFHVGDFSEVGADIYLNITGHDVDSSWTFSNKTDFDDRVKTSNYVLWNHTGEWDWVSSPELKQVVQEVIDRDGWASGNNLTLLIHENTQETGEIAYFASYDMGADPPYLEVTYSTTGDPPSIGGVTPVKMGTYEYIVSRISSEKYFDLRVFVSSNNSIYYIENASITLNNSITLAWDNSTDTYSLESDPNGYCTLNASASETSVENTTTWKLKWNIKLSPVSSWNITGVVYDKDDLTGTMSKEDVFITDKLNVVLTASPSDPVEGDTVALSWTVTRLYTGEEADLESMTITKNGREISTIGYGDESIEDTEGDTPTNEYDVTSIEDYFRDGSVTSFTCEGLTVTWKSGGGVQSSPSTPPPPPPDEEEPEEPEEPSAPSIPSVPITPPSEEESPIPGVSMTVFGAVVIVLGIVGVVAYKYIPKRKAVGNYWKRNKRTAKMWKKKLSRKTKMPKWKSHKEKKKK